jgi:hypothetical protein
MSNQKRCTKHEWKHKGSYTEVVGGKERYTEHYICTKCKKRKRVVPSMKTSK